jgi:hypothetical protein
MTNLSPAEIVEILRKCGLQLKTTSSIKILIFYLELEDCQIESSKCNTTKIIVDRLTESNFLIKDARVKQIIAEICKQFQSLLEKHECKVPADGDIRRGTLKRAIYDFVDMIPLSSSAQNLSLNL